MAEFHYKVIKPFTYGKKRLKVGDTWEPDGGKFDKTIANGPMVSLEPVEHEAEEPPKTTTRRRTAAKRKANE